MDEPTDTRALELLQRALGTDAQFREGQLEAVVALVDRRARVLVIQRTGWGKSVVYFVATKLLRDRGAGPTILISPLLSLIRDQLKAAERLGLRAASIDSTNPDQWSPIEAALARDEVDILLVSPERLGNERFQTVTIPSIGQGIGLFVVDEAHCISDWGHDFRPDYQRIDRLVRALPAGVPLLATTATANSRVQSDVEVQLGPDLEVFRGPLGRDSLHLQVVKLDDQAERLAWLVEYLRNVEGSGIVYTLTVRDADRVSDWLATQGIDAPAYHSRLGDEERLLREKRLLGNDVKALVATVALGMGFDKPDLAFVVHFQRPGSVIFYYQQIGRAGRAVDRAEVVLLSGREDDEITSYFINTAFPPEEELLEVLSAIESVDQVGARELESRLNLSRTAITRALKFLALEGVVAHTGSGWARTVNTWDSDQERGARVTATREREQERMRDYTSTEGCLMAFLTSELDDPASASCGRCANCAGLFARIEPDPALVNEAVRFLKRAYRPIEPRKQWPPGLGDPRGRIDDGLILQEGRALCVYGDAGWGRLVMEGKYGQAGFDDELVDAALEMLTEWHPDPAPTWVTAVPSWRHPELVPGFARRLAARLGLPYRDALVKVRETKEQKRMENSIQQVRNTLGAFEAVREQVLDGPVLLVDDMVDSRWSMTICGIALAAAGSGPVIPLALGETTSGSAP
jgi:ATP-dependent DNA helicase RecQ